MTPTMFLYEAAMKTRMVTSPVGKEVIYGPIEPGPLEGQCYLCGGYSTGYPRNKVIKDTFYNHYPELWAYMRELDERSIERFGRKFRSDYSIEELERKFDAENQQQKLF